MDARDPNGHEGGWGGRHNSARVHPDIGSSRVRRRPPNPHRRPRVPAGGSGAERRDGRTRQNLVPFKKGTSFCLISLGLYVILLVPFFGGTRIPFFWRPKKGILGEFLGIPQECTT